MGFSSFYVAVFLSLFFFFTEHLVCTRFFTVYTPVREYRQETGKRVQRLPPAGIHAMRRMKGESPAGVEGFALDRAAGGWE